MFLWVFPVVLGQGKRLFGADAMPAGFTVSSTELSSTGVLMTGYWRADLRPAASFALPD
jgi:dihydrofolate reductase